MTLLVNPKRVPALYNKHGSLKAAARAIGVSYRAVQNAYNAAVEQGIMQDVKMGRKSHAHQKAIVQRVKALKTTKARHKAYILTSAQNNTRIHQGTWENLLAYAKHTGAEIFVSTFLYAARSHWQKNLDKGNVTLDTKGVGKGKRELAELWYDPAVLDYINNNRVEIAPGLVWCGELNIIPTRQDPFTKLKVYTGRNSMVVPHAKTALQSIPTLGGSGTKFNYSTGTVTLRNYIQRADGFAAEFHHSYGALYVEVDDNGNWWARQLIADSDGTIKDLDTKIEDGKVTTGNRVEAITFGDIHADEIDEEVAEATWGKGGMVDVLRPRFQFFHDVLNMGRRSHHNIKNPYKMLEYYAQGRDRVEDDVRCSMTFLEQLSWREWSQSVVVPSNHDEHLDKWLSTVDGRFDPPNAEFWGQLNSAKTEHIIREGSSPACMFQFAVNYLDPSLEGRKNILFLDRDTSFVICPKFGGGIECALHFDQGGNGSRGNLRQFADMGRRMNGGHSHTAGIYLGAWQAGTKSKMFLGYNHGLSSWSWSDIITHDNGKRQIVTFFKAHGKTKWRA